MKEMDSKGSEMQNYYGNSLQHLLDELKRIDLLIRWQIHRLRKERLNDPREEFRGLFISEEEIDDILKSNLNPSEEYSSRTPESAEADGFNEIFRELNTRITQRTSASLEKGVCLSLFRLACLFELTPFETDCILVCLAPELEIKYERLYAYLQNDVTKKRPTVDLVLKLLCHSFEDKIRSRLFFLCKGPLVKCHLLRFFDEVQERQTPLISRSLKLDDRIVDFLLGFHGVDSKIKGFARIKKPQAQMNELIIPSGIKKTANQLLPILKNGKKNRKRISLTANPVLYLKGPSHNGQLQVAEAMCRRMNLNLLEADMDGLISEDLPFEMGIELVLREALLQSSAVYFKRMDRFLEEAEKNGTKEGIFLSALEDFPGPVFLEGEKKWEPKSDIPSFPFFKLEFPVPPYSLRKKLWESSLKGCPVQDGLDINDLANKFQFTGGEIRDAVQNAMRLAFMRNSGGFSLSLEDLYEGCRARSNQRLAFFSRKIQPRYGWKDIVLPKDKLSQLKDISNYVKYKNVVYGDWGFDQKLSQGKGLNAFFHGPSGTGKTMAAEVISRDLGLDLYKIDLSSVVSKYIGETEKNLNKIFKEAETSNSILFFDEADALFGKRSEVKDSHDRYANIEVAYLLQKMEEYEGIVVMASNFMKNVDDAFIRRIHFSVEFPFPDEEHRLRIWKMIFPDEAPRDGDIDFEFLSKKFKIAGGNIKNIILSAAFLAAENSGKIDMSHIILATKREFQKMGKLCIQSDFGKYYELTLES